MIIHCSGMDCTGKSTICKKLSELLKCPIQHFDKPKDLDDGKKQYFDFQKNINSNKNIICDRYHDGEYIYAPLYRGYEADYLHEFENELRKSPYLFVNTIASLNTIIERIKTRGEDFVKEEHYQNVLDLFERYIEKQSMPYIKINTDDSNIDCYLKQILSAIDIVQKLYNFKVKNVCQNLYYGNIVAKYFIIVDDDITLEQVKEKIITEGIYHDSWITTSEDKNFVNYQIELLQPKNIINIIGGKIII